MPLLEEVVCVVPGDFFTLLLVCIGDLGISGKTSSYRNLSQFHLLLIMGRKCGWSREVMVFGFEYIM